MKEKLLSLVGSFTWLWGQEFFIETEIGSFIWNAPNYDGDNTMRKYIGSYQDYLTETKTPFGRDKGQHIISHYCGDKFVVVG